MADALARRGVTGLFLHQAQAWEAARRGEDVIVTTGTASGKSLAFSLPVLDAVARDPHARALFLYPTKVLAQDQARALDAFGLKGLRPAIYDGDTPSEARPQVRRSANVIHQPGHAQHRRAAAPRPVGRRAPQPPVRRRRRGARVPRRCLGSHAANVLRRLRRAARAYGADPQFLLATATIANAAELAGRADRTRRHRGGHRHVPACGARDRPLEPTGDGRGARHPCERARRGVAPDERPRHARAAHDLLREEPEGGRADPPLRVRPRRPRDGATARPLPRGVHRPATPRDRGAPRRRRAPGSRRRTRSSSASTSGCSTVRSPSASPAPSPRCGSSGAEQAGASGAQPC